MDIYVFKYDFEIVFFYIVLIFDDFDDCFWVWKILFDDICNDYVLWKEVRIKSCVFFWLINDICYKMNEWFKLFKVVMVNRCLEVWLVYKRVCNSVIRVFRKVKVFYFIKMFGEVKNLIFYWNLVNRVINLKSWKIIGLIR